MQQEENATYRSIAISQPLLNAEEIETLHLNGCQHINLPTVHSEYQKLLRMSLGIRSNPSLKTTIKQHILNRSWATSFVIMERIVLPATVPGAKKKPANKANSSTVPVKTATKETTAPKSTNRPDFRTKCAEWNKKANDLYFIYRVSHDLSHSPAILFIQKDCKLEKRIVPGQVILVKNASIVKRKQKSPEYQFVENQDIADENSLPEQAATKKNSPPIGLMIKSKESIVLLGTAENYAICKYTTYGMEYEDKQLFDALMGETKKKSNFSADALACTIPVNKKDGEFCMHHYARKVAERGGTRMEISSTLMLRPQSVNSDKFTSSIIFTLGEDLQVLIDPLLNLKSQRKREDEIDLQKRAGSNKRAQKLKVSNETIDKLSNIQNMSRGAQIIMASQKQKAIERVEQQILKSSTKHSDITARALATQAVNKGVLKRRSSATKKEVITFELSSSEDDEDSDEEPQMKRRKIV